MQRSSELASTLPERVKRLCPHERLVEEPVAQAAGCLLSERGALCKRCERLFSGVLAAGERLEERGDIGHWVGDRQLSFRQQAMGSCERADIASRRILLGEKRGWRFPLCWDRGIERFDCGHCVLFGTISMRGTADGMSGPLLAASLTAGQTIPFSVATILRPFASVFTSTGSAVVVICATTFRCAKAKDPASRDSRRVPGKQGKQTRKRHWYITRIYLRSYLQPTNITSCLQCGRPAHVSETVSEYSIAMVAQKLSPHSVGAGSTAVEVSRSESLPKGVGACLTRCSLRAGTNLWREERG